MNLSNYKEAHALDFLEIKDRIGLTEEQFEKLQELFYEEDYILIKYPKIDKKQAMYRLSMPFYIICYLLLFLIFMPLKWLVTGNFYMKVNKPIYKFMNAWKNKI